MTEKELQQYLLLHYPKEDTGCEWKEFKNLKNDFNGKENTLEDLDPQALMMARFQFKQVHPDLNADVDKWDDMKLLTHAGIASHGKLTRAALILLGKSSSAILLNPAVVQVTWILKDDLGRKIAYEHFGMPLLTNVDRILSKIRNLTIRELPEGTLFPDIDKQYDDYSIRELLHNSIAHEDYSMQQRIVLIEEPNSLTFSNGGYFLPGTLQNALENGGPQKYYRNYCLCQGMVSFNMIDTIGHGIEKVFSEQKRRHCALPEYSINNVDKEVSVKVYARQESDMKESFMTSGKDELHQESIRKEPFMTSQKKSNVIKELTEVQDLILIAIHRDQSITTAELSDLTGITTRNVARNLKKLQELGFLKRVGGRKNGYWEVIKLD